MKKILKRIIIISLIALVVELIAYTLVDNIENAVTKEPQVETHKAKNIVEEVLGNNNYNNKESKESTEKETEVERETVPIVVQDKYTTSKKLKTYAVEKVVDGDTFFIIYNGKKEKVRLIGVDTPESVNYNPDKNCKFGEIASYYTKKLIEGKSVEIELGESQDRDIYNRLLAYVYVDKEMLNYKLAYNGYAVAMSVPPNIRYSNLFKQAQIRAQNTKVGMWKSDVSEIDCPNKAESYIYQ